MIPTITRSQEGHDLVFTASGAIIRESAQDLAAQLEHLDPEAFPVVTVDLRHATSLDPVVVHALFHARDRRSGNEEGGSGPEGEIRILVAAGRVQRFLDSLRLEPAFEVVQEESDEQSSIKIPIIGADQWNSARMGGIEHWHELLAAARRHDGSEFTRLSRASHPICVAAGAEPGGPAFGPWCQACPLHAQYGGCRALLDQAARAADLKNWDAAQLLVLALIAEAAGMSLHDGAGKDPG